MERLRTAYVESPASALAMLPELFLAVDNRKIVEPLDIPLNKTLYWLGETKSCRYGTKASMVVPWARAKNFMLWKSQEPFITLGVFTLCIFMVSLQLQNFRSATTLLWLDIS